MVKRNRKIDYGDMPLPPTKEEIKALGLERFMIDRTPHPDFYVSTWPVTGAGQDTLGANARYRLPHLNANSVLITVISNRWLEGGWHRLQDMIRYTEDQGITVALEEVDDLSTMPHDAIGIMRACAAMLALDSGFEWCFMIDTDILLEKDTLVKLMAHDRPVVFPLVRDLNEEFKGAPLSGPVLPSGHGLQPVIWGTLACMLFNTKVFNCLDAQAWYGHDYHFAQMLGHHGHRIHIDTDTLVNLTRGPARHPIKPWSQLWGDLEKTYTKWQSVDRDRNPPPDFDSAFDPGYLSPDGTYWGRENWRYTGVNGPNQQEKNGATGDG